MPICSHIEAKLHLSLKMMPKINDFEDRIEHLEYASTASDRLMERKIYDLLGRKKLKRFFNMKKKNLREII